MTPIYNKTLTPGKTGILKQKRKQMEEKYNIIQGGRSVSKSISQEAMERIYKRTGNWPDLYSNEIEAEIQSIILERKKK